MWLLMLFAYAQDPGETTPAPSDPVEEDEPVDAPEPLPKPTPQPPVEAKIYTLPPLEGELPSALDTPHAVLEDSSLSEFMRSTGLDEGDFDRPTLIRGQWFFKPHTSVSQLIGDEEGGAAALRLGLSAGRRFTTLKALPIQLMSEIGVKGSAAMFGAVGRRVEGFANIGPWLGPVRVQLGLHGRWEQERWRKRTLVLGDAVLVGGELSAAMNAGPLLLNIGILPLVAVSGERPSAREGSPKLPVIGTETVYTAGVGFQPGAFGIRAHSSWRDTHLGGLLEVGLSLSLNLAELK